MTRAVGWYVHHHGRGHVTRLLAVAPYVDRTIRVFSSLDEPNGLPENCSWTTLPRDDDPFAGGTRTPADADPTARGMLHWAPLGHPGHRARLSAIATSLADDPVSSFVVDVSAEISLFLRLLGVRTIVVAQPGRRDDETHQLAYRAAEAIIAPWPRDLLEPAHLHPHRDRTVYTGGISRFDDLRPPLDAELAAGSVVLLGSRGGTGISESQISQAEEVTAGPWQVLGDGSRGGWSDDPWPILLSASVVVSWAGQNAIADIAAAGAAAIVLPQARPFDEQLETARALDRAGLAVVAEGWPPAEAWPELIDRATALEPDWSRWHVDGAAKRAAATIETIAWRADEAS